MSRLWVDYTNHRGERAWRDIAINGVPFLTTYPPAAAETTVERRETMCITVWMYDRKAGRTLALESIHGFAYGAVPPQPVVPTPTGHPEAEIAEARFKTIMRRLDELQLVAAAATPSSDVMVRLGEPFLNRLRDANRLRQQEWWYDIKQPDVTLATLYRANELAGEVGELCNGIKKLTRAVMGLKGSRVTLAKVSREFGDVLICLDLLADMIGVDLEAQTIDAFDAKSQEHGFATMLGVSDVP